MIIKSLSGKIIHQSSLKSMRLALEECADSGIILDGADLRRLKLCHCNLDGIRARGASFWGSDLEGTDMGVADLKNADLRCTNLKDVCFAQSDLRGCDLRGAYFSRTILEEAMLENTDLSYPHLKFYAQVEGVLLRRRAQDAAAVSPDTQRPHGCLWRIHAEFTN